MIQIELFINLLISILIPIILGLSVIQRLLSRFYLNTLIKLSLSTLLGSGLLSLIMHITIWLDLPFSRNFLSILTLFISFIILYTFPKTNILNTEKNQFLPAYKDTLTITQKKVLTLIWAFIILQCFFILTRSLTIPIFAWDSVERIAFKGKVFFYNHSILESNIRQIFYPLHIPLSQAWTALNLNTWHETLTKIIFPLTFFPFVIYFYTYLRNQMNKFYASLGLGILLSSAFFTYHASINYTDVPVSIFNTITILTLLIWSDRRASSLLILSGLFSGLAAWTKTEGLSYFLIQLLFLLLLQSNKQKPTSLKRKTLSALTFTIPFIVMTSLYVIYKIMHGIPVLQGRPPEFIVNISYYEKFLIILKTFFTELFLTGNWNIIWIAITVGLFLNLKRLSNHTTRCLTLCLLSYFTFYLLMSLFTSCFYDTAGAGSSFVIGRLFLHFYPIGVLLFMHLIKPEEQN